jgi:hypothetical protein
MTVRLTSTEIFDTHVSNLRENFVISNIRGHLIQPDKQVDILKESLAGHVLIEKILHQYDFVDKDESLHTFESIVTYVEDHLPNLQESSRVSARATANIMSSEAYTTLKAENKRYKLCRRHRRPRSANAVRERERINPRRRIGGTETTKISPSSTATPTGRNTHTIRVSVN